MNSNFCGIKLTGSILIDLYGAFKSPLKRKKGRNASNKPLLRK